MHQHRDHLFLTQPSCQKIGEHPTGHGNAATTGGVGVGFVPVLHVQVDVARWRVSPLQRGSPGLSAVSRSLPPPSATCNRT